MERIVWNLLHKLRFCFEGDFFRGFGTASSSYVILVKTGFVRFGETLQVCRMKVVPSGLEPVARPTRQSFVTVSS